MADPFSVEPPRWLQQVAKPIDAEKLGHSLGMSLMSLAAATERDPNAPEDASFLESRKGINQGWYETQMNERDPQWRVKGQLLANQVLQQKAQLAATAALAEERRKETSAWMEDAPTLTPWITATPEQRKTMTAPAAKSKLGLTALQKQSVADQTYFTRQDQMDNRLEQERLKADHSAGITARVGDWNDAYAAADALTQSDISAMKNNGRLPSGMPTPEAITRLNVYRRQSGMTDFGTRATEYLQRPGRFDAETVDRLKELDADERDLRKQIATANAAGETDKVTGLTAQLDEVRRMRSEVRGDKPASGASGAPTDAFQKQATAIEDKMNDALARGKDGEKAYAAAMNEHLMLFRKESLKRGYKITASSNADQVARIVNSAPIGFSIYIEPKKQWKMIAQESDRQNILDQFGGSSVKAGTATGTSGSRAPIPGIATPEVAFPHRAAPQAGRGAGSAARQAQAAAAETKVRIEELTNLLKNANKGRGTFMTQEEYARNYDELAQLMATQ